MSDTPLTKWAITINSARQYRDGCEEDEIIADLADYATAQQQRIAALERQLAEAQAEVEKWKDICGDKDESLDHQVAFMHQLSNELEAAKAGTWQPVDSVKCACDDPGCRVRAFFEPPDKMIVTDGKNTVSLLYVADHIRLCQFVPAPAEPEPSRAARKEGEVSDELKPKLDLARAIRSRWGDNWRNMDADSYRYAHNEILDLLDVIDALKAALDARPQWPTGDEAAEQLARATWTVGLETGAGTPWDRLPAYYRQARIDRAAAVLARLNRDATTKESEQ